LVYFFETFCLKTRFTYEREDLDNYQKLSTIFSCNNLTRKIILKIMIKNKNKVGLIKIIQGRKFKLLF